MKNGDKIVIPGQPSGAPVHGLSIFGAGHHPEPSDAIDYALSDLLDEPVEFTPLAVIIAQITSGSALAVFGFSAPSNVTKEKCDETKKALLSSLKYYLTFSLPKTQYECLVKTVNNAYNSLLGIQNVSDSLSELYISKKFTLLSLIWMSYHAEINKSKIVRIFNWYSYVDILPRTWDSASGGVVIGLSKRQLLNPKFISSAIFGYFVCIAPKIAEPLKGKAHLDSFDIYKEASDLFKSTILSKFITGDHTEFLSAMTTRYMPNNLVVNIVGLPKRRGARGKYLFGALESFPESFRTVVSEKKEVLSNELSAYLHHDYQLSGGGLSLEELSKLRQVQNRLNRLFSGLELKIYYLPNPRGHTRLEFKMNLLVYFSKVAPILNAGIVPNALSISLEEKGEEAVVSSIESGEGRTRMVETYYKPS